MGWATGKTNTSTRPSRKMVSKSTSIPSASSVMRGPEVCALLSSHLQRTVRRCSMRQASPSSLTFV